MKVFCEYSMVDVDTGASLAFGKKWKTTDKLNADYINDGTIGFFRKRTMYHRNIEINGRRCVILLFALHFRCRSSYFNCLTKLGFDYRINGQNVTINKKTNQLCFKAELDGMGIVGVGVYA